MKNLTSFLNESLINEAVDMKADITFKKNYEWYSLKNLELSAEHSTQDRDFYYTVLSSCGQYKKGSKIIIPRGTTCKYLGMEDGYYQYEVPGVDPEEVTLKLSDEDSIYLEGASRANTTVSIKDFEFVDLGLPSGTKWATMNVGALTSEEAGDYMAYLSTRELYGRNLPTAKQFDELSKECTLTTEKIKGNIFIKVTGPNQNYILLPEAGAYRDSGKLELVNEYGYYCSKDPKYLAIVHHDYQDPLGYIKGGRVTRWRVNVRLVSK